MRTTLVIDDRLLHKARSIALARGLTVSEVVNEALRVSFADSRPEARPFMMITHGGVPDGTGHEPEDFWSALQDEDRGQVGR